MTQENNNPIIYSADFMPYFYILQNDVTSRKAKIFNSSFVNLGLNFTIFESVKPEQLSVKNLNSNNNYSGSQMVSMKALTNKNDPYTVNCGDEAGTEIFYNGTVVSSKNLADWCTYKLVWQDALNKSLNDVIVFSAQLAPIDLSLFKSQVVNFMNALPDTYDIGLMNVQNIRKGNFTALPENQLIAVPSKDINWNGINAASYSDYGMQKILDLSYFSTVKDRQILQTCKNDLVELYMSSETIFDSFANSSMSKLPVGDLQQVMV